jgi:hypothetical protein
MAHAKGTRGQLDFTLRGRSTDPTWPNLVGQSHLVEIDQANRGFGGGATVSAIPADRCHASLLDNREIGNDRQPYRVAHAFVKSDAAGDCRLLLGDGGDEVDDIVLTFHDAARVDAKVTVADRRGSTTPAPGAHTISEGSMVVVHADVLDAEGRAMGVGELLEKLDAAPQDLWLKDDALFHDKPIDDSEPGWTLGFTSPADAGFYVYGASKGELRLRVGTFDERWTFTVVPRTP